MKGRFSSSARDPFRLQSGSRGGLRVTSQGDETLRHEVLFEDRFTRLRDRRVFVGQGIGLNRLFVVIGIALVVLGGLALRAGYMQIVRGSAYAEAAEDNRLRREVLPARRGIIRDRQGTVLAENVPTFQVDMRASDLPSPIDSSFGTAQELLQTGTPARIIATVARAVGKTTEDIAGQLSATGTVPNEWVTVARDIPYEQAVSLEVALPELSGVALTTAAKRQYPESGATPSLSPVLGYVGPVSPTEYADRKEDGYRRNDEIGKVGVERSHEDTIRGTPGERRTEVDAFGHPRAVVSDRAPVDGQDLTLTLDLGLQRAAEDALRKGMERAKVTRGSAILMDARDGGILALVSLPAYDNNIFAGSVSSTAYQALLDNEDRPLFPRAWAGQFPSGSTIKPLIATAALAEHVVTPVTTVFSVGGINVGPWFFPDWKAGGHGPTNVRYALAWSVNTFFYYVGGGYGEFIGLGVDRLTSWMRAFGLGDITGLDLPGEATGHVPSQAWKEQTTGERWYIGDTYNLSIGQGDLLVTPMQMARVAATVANGGSLVIPHLVASSSTPNVPRLDADPADLATVRQGMRDCVTYGSCRALSVLPVPVAGKTGTAQWRSDRENHAWFIGFAPADDPQVVITVLLEEGGEGSSFAVPVAGEILRAWWSEEYGD